MTILEGLLPLLLGLGTGLSLIIAIGSQNAYVLRLGIEGNTRTVALAVTICAVSDAALILAGVFGVGAVVENAPVALVVIRIVGSAFLLIYGLLAAIRVFRPKALVVEGAEESGVADVAGRVVAGAGPGSGSGSGSGGTVVAAPPRPQIRLRTALLTVLALTWLNPHVYLDTVIFLGSVANQQGVDDRWWWTAGAVTASFIWFYSLGFGARLLRPFFARPSSWRILDAFIAVVMLTLGLRMALGA